MPYKANAARRHQFSKAQYRVKNWGEYDRALQERGSLTLWGTPEAIAAWHASPTGGAAVPAITLTWRSRPPPARIQTHAELGMNVNRSRG
jgi:hypothetical protein